jgi:type III pantothenate kinase
VSSLLVVDIGNTTTKAGAWNGETVEAVSVAPTRESESLIGAVPRLMAAAGRAGGPQFEVAICSVVPEAEAAWLEWCKRDGRSAFAVRGETRTPLANRYRAPARLGPDRLAAAVGAAKRFGAPVIVASIGTAVVVDAVSQGKEYLGGAIWVGVTTGLEALAQRTAGLPNLAVEHPCPSISNESAKTQRTQRIETHPPSADNRRNHRDLWMVLSASHGVMPEAPSTPIGGDTESCLRAGAVYGTAALVEGLAAQMRGFVGEQAPLVLTGGEADLISSYLRAKHEVVPYLTLEGIGLIWEHGRGQADANR